MIKDQLKIYCRSDLSVLIGIALLYVVFTQVVISFFSFNDKIVLAWPPSWLALAIMLIRGEKYWPGIFVGAFSAGILMELNAIASLLTAIGSTVAPLAGTMFLKRKSHFDLSMGTLYDYLMLAMAALISSSVYALINTSSQIMPGMAAYQSPVQDFLSWWKNDLLGVILATPIMLAWQKFPRWWFRHDRLLETVVCFGLAVLAGQIIFLGLFNNLVGSYAKAFLMFIFIAWSAVRFGRQGVFLIISITGVQALLGAINGLGFFAQDIAQTNLTNLWFYIMVLTWVGLALDFVMNELRRSEQREKTRNQILEMLAMDAPLLNILQTIIHNVERENVNMMCCILLVGDKGEQLFKGSVSSTLNNIYPASCSLGLDISTNLCLNTILSGKHLIVGDVQKHPCFTQYEITAAKASLHSCWSKPIKSHSGKILGAIAMYRKSAVSQTTDDIQLMEHIANLAGVAIDQSRINEELQQAMLVYQNSSDAMTVSDAEGIIINVNPAFTTLTGYTPDEIIGRSHKVLSSGRQDREFYQAMWNCINTTGRWQGEILNRRKNGEIYTEWLTINSIFNEDGSVHRRVALFSDISMKKETEALIWKQANFDPLTELPNRTMFLDRLSQKIKIAHRDNIPLALLFIDLDHFKEVNDTLGHSMGDILLKAAASRILGCVRETDTVTRLGGDEFTVILDGLDNLRSIERTVQDILREIAMPFQLGSEKVFVSASIGITLYPKDAIEIEALLKNADQAMYAAKHQGRNRYSYFSRSMQESAQKRMRLTSDLRDALEDNQFRIEYQPIVDLATGNTTKAEALIRWEHPTHGLVSPASFIPIAEETGIIVNIGDWVFRQAAQQVSIWKKSLHPDFQISINKSPVQFNYDGDTQSSDHWPRYLQMLGLPRKSIVMEITEGLLLEANGTVIDRIRTLREAGFLISLDDFGTGYSSLTYLKRFDIDFLKIDQSFVRNLNRDSDDMALCEAIIVMAHKLGIKVVAEGIETEEQRSILLSAGCDYGQGFLFSRPVTAAEFEKLHSARAMNQVLDY